MIDRRVDGQTDGRAGPVIDSSGVPVNLWYLLLRPTLLAVSFRVLNTNSLVSLCNLFCFRPRGISARH